MAATRRLIARKVVAVVGHFCSAASMSASRFYAEAGIVQISPASTNPAFTENRPGRGVFRVVAADGQQGSFAGKYMAEKFKGRPLAIISDGTSYGDVLAGGVRDALKRAGANLTIDETVSSEESSVAAVVSRLPAYNIAAVYMAGYHETAGVIARQVRKRGLTPQLFGSDALVTNGFRRFAGDASEGTLMTFIADAERNPAAKRLVKELRARGLRSTGYVIYAYAAVDIWADAVQWASSTEYNKVADAIMGTDRVTVIGRIRFDENGDLKDPPLEWFVWRMGKYIPVERQ